MGKDFPGTVLPSTFGERLREFRASTLLTMQCSVPRRIAFEFGKYFREDDRDSRGYDCGPDLENAVSTLVVRARPSEQAGVPKYWLRRVCVITLAEVLCHYKDWALWEEIYNMWLEGAVVIRKRSPRGRREGTQPRWRRKKRPRLEGGIGGCRAIGA